MGTHLVHSGRRAARLADALRRTFTLVIGSGAVMFAALAVSTAHAQSPGADMRNVAIDVLKKAYLACGRAAMSGQLNTAEIMQCSVVYEELKLRAFGGDFEKMRAWSRAQSDQVPDGRLY